jgi:hypothetical protein
LFSNYKLNLIVSKLSQVVPEPKGIADNLDELAADTKKLDINFVDKNGVEQKVVEINDDVDEEDKMVAPSEDDVERVKRLLRLAGK